MMYMLNVEIIILIGGLKLIIRVVALSILSNLFRLIFFINSHFYTTELTVLLLFNDNFHFKSS